MTEQKQETQDQEVKLYAGKFKTVDDLEAGYKNSAAVYDENTNLKKQIEEATKIPDSYLNPSDVQMDEHRVADIQARAKEAGMTQAQYEKFLRGDKSRLDNHQQNFEKSRKDLGEETVNLLQDYVKKNYLPEVQDSMLKTFILNKEARQAALNHRSQLLNNQVPGMNKVSAGGYIVTQEDVNKAYAAKEANKADIKARNHYLNLLAQQAAQKNDS